MKKYHVKLQTEVSKTFHAQLAAQSLDIDTEAKSVHELEINAVLDTDFSIGLIVGSSGSGKTTLARSIFGAESFNSYLDGGRAVIDQFPEGMNYEERAAALTGIGLSSVPCWIKPAHTLSNGQRARAEAALALAHSTGAEKIIAIDEWTSVVDRTVAKAMSHCVQKYARRAKRKIVLLSCHFDVAEWLDPDWIIDCNSATFIDRRLLPAAERARKERLEFEVREVTSGSWSQFSKYHYLNARLPGGRIFHFGLFRRDNGAQIGYNCLVNYVPHADKSKPMIMHVSRTVIHPDYTGMGLGIQLDSAVAEYGSSILKYRVMAKFSSIPFYKMMSKHAHWRYIKTDRQIGKMKVGSIDRGNQQRASKSTGFRENIKTYTFEYIS